MPDTTPELPGNVVIQDLEGAGRPGDLTEEILEQMVRYVGVVSYIEPACHMVGVPIRTVRAWMTRGVTVERAIKRAEKRGEPAVMTEHEARCLRLLHTVRRATASLEIQHAGNITRSAMGRPTETTTTERVLADGTIERTIRIVEGRAPDWRASLAYLERTQFKRWGRKTQHLAPETTGTDSGKEPEEVQQLGTAPTERMTLAAVRAILAEDQGAPAPLALPAAGESSAA